MTEQANTQDEILALYADGPAQLEAVLNDLSDSDLNLASGPDSWSIRQIVHHLADGDDLWKTCVKAALGNSDGAFTLQWYWDKSQLEWSESWHYASRGLESSLVLLRANRQQIMELIQQTPDAWEKSIWLNSPKGPKERISIGWVLEMQARHIVEHIKDIQTIQQAHTIRE